VGVAGGPATPPAFAYLTGEESSLARRDIGEMLLVCARASLDGRPGVPSDDPRLREARRWNGVAEQFLTDGAGRPTLLLPPARLAHEAGEHDVADRLRDEAEKSSSRTPFDHFLDAWQAMSDGKYRAALGIIAEGLQLDPQNAPLWSLRGRYYAELGEHDRAAA